MTAPPSHRGHVIGTEKNRNKHDETDCRFHVPSRMTSNALDNGVSGTVTL